MAYEWRKGHLYYYQKVRENGHVRSVYAGVASSPITQLTAEFDKLTRTQQALARMGAEDARAELAAAAAPPEDLALLLERAQAEAARVLEQAGYHQHKRGEWRKKRVSKDETSSGH